MNRVSGYVENDRSERLAYIFETPVSVPTGLVVVMYGRTSKMEGSTATDMAAVAHRHDLATMRFDFRGHGDSFGSPKWEDFGVMDFVDDISAIVTHVKENSLPGCDRIVLVGASFSADPALLYAAGDKDIERVVLISPGTGKGSSGTTSNERREYWWDTVSDTTQIDFAEFKRKVGCVSQPVDMLHGTADESVPIEQSQEIASIVGEQVKVHRILGGRHHYTQPPEALVARRKILDDIFTGMAK